MLTNRARESSGVFVVQSRYRGRAGSMPPLDVPSVWGCNPSRGSSLSLSLSLWTS